MSVWSWFSDNPDIATAVVQTVGGVANTAINQGTGANSGGSSSSSSSSAPDWAAQIKNTLQGILPDIKGGMDDNTSQIVKWSVIAVVGLGAVFLLVWAFKKK